MNYTATFMTNPFEKEKNKRALLITAGIAGVMVLAFIFWKWPLPKIEIPPTQEFIEIDLDLPEEPMATIGGGGGGGNPVQASGPAGVAPTVPQPGDNEDAKDIEDIEKDEAAPKVLRPDKPKPEATKINSNKSVVKTEPKVITPPAPPKPKAVAGKTLTGNGTGGGTSENYDRPGGAGTGTGVGTGSGTGGGNGTGTGGGNGSGSGTGTGPRKISGNRVVINPKNMNAGENLKGKVLAEIKVSPDGIGTFIRAARGSSYTSGPAIQIIRDWLRQNRFSKGTDDAIVVYEFSFLLGGG
jgi:hypothetical protein